MISEADFDRMIGPAVVRDSAAYTLADVKALLAERRAALFANGHACIVAQVVETARRRRLHYWLAGGDLAPLLDLQPEVDAWGRDEGATEATLLGRPGWQRVLPAHGWRTVGAAMIKGLQA